MAAGSVLGAKEDLKIWADKCLGHLRIIKAEAMSIGNQWASDPMVLSTIVLLARLNLNGKVGLMDALKIIFQPSQLPKRRGHRRWHSLWRFLSATVVVLIETGA